LGTVRVLSSNTGVASPGWKSVVPAISVGGGSWKSTSRPSSKSPAVDERMRFDPAVFSGDLARVVRPFPLLLEEEGRATLGKIRSC